MTAKTTDLGVMTKQERSLVERSKKLERRMLRLQKDGGAAEAAQLATEAEAAKAKVDEKLSQLQVRMLEARAAADARTRRARNHAMIVIGSTLVAHAGITWEEVDMDALDRWLAEHAGELRALAAPKMEPDDACKRIRIWEKSAHGVWPTTEELDAAAEEWGMSGSQKARRDEARRLARPEKKEGFDPAVQNELYENGEPFYDDLPF